MGGGSWQPAALRVIHKRRLYKIGDFWPPPFLPYFFIPSSFRLAPSLSHPPFCPLEMTFFMDGPLADVTTMACFYTFLAGPSFVLCFRRFLTSPRFVTTVVSVLDWTQTTMYYYRLQLCTREQRLRKRGEPGHPPQLMPLGLSEDTNCK